MSIYIQRFKEWIKKRKVWSNMDAEMFEYFLKEGQWYSIQKLVRVFIEHNAGDIGEMPQEQARIYFVKGAIANKAYALGQDDEGNWFVKRKEHKHGH